MWNFAHLALQNSNKIVCTPFSCWAMKFWKLMVEFLCTDCFSDLTPIFLKTCLTFAQFKNCFRAFKRFWAWSQNFMIFRAITTASGRWVPKRNKSKKVEKSELSSVWICAAKFDHTFSKNHSLATEGKCVSYSVSNLLKSYMAWPQRPLKDKVRFQLRTRYLHYRGNWKHYIFAPCFKI